MDPCMYDTPQQKTREAKKPQERKKEDQNKSGYTDKKQNERLGQTMQSPAVGHLRFSALLRSRRNSLKTPYIHGAVKIAYFSRGVPR